MEILIGVLSDTHGLLRNEVMERLKRCALIVHAGDIGACAVLEELEKIARVVAVRGNVDHAPWAFSLPKTQCVDYRGMTLYVIHNREELAIDPQSAGINVVIYGHSHKPSVSYQGPVLYLNPGSAGPRRFDLPVSMAFLKIQDEKILPELIEISE